MMVTENRVGGSKCDYVAYFKVQIIKYGLKISEKSVLQGADRTPSILQLPYCRIMLSVCILPLKLPHENYSREESSSNVLLWTVQMYFSLFLINVIAPRIFFFTQFHKVSFQRLCEHFVYEPQRVLFHSYFFCYYHQVFAMPLKGVWCVQMARWLKALASFPEDPHLIPSIHNLFSSSIRFQTHSSGFYMYYLCK